MPSHQIARSWACLGLLLPLLAHAGRPLSTDDAGTADVSTCQVEGWWSGTGDDHTWVLSPACGVAEGLEVGLEASVAQPRRGESGQLTLAAKWAPASLSWESPAGEVRFGLKMAVATHKPQGAHWRSAGQTVLGLATWAPTEALQVHLNLGGLRDANAHVSASAVNLAVAADPSESWLVFAELQSNSRREVFGPTTYQTGVRYWLQPDRWGLDVTAARAQGGGPTTWTLGFGWYGLGG